MSQPPEQPRGTPIWPGILIGVLVFALVAGGAYAVVSLRDGDAGGSSSSGSADGGATSAPSAQSGPMPSTSAELARYYGQKVRWVDCGSAQCASMTVPLDYDDPDGQTIELKMLKVPASGKRVGSLLVNPGGPGGSAIQYASAGSAQWPSTLLEHYDLVGLDPRGVGQSTQLKCLDTQGTDALVASDPDPDTDTERTQLDQLIKGFGDACLTNSGDLAKHMSTVEAAKDMDVARQVLGDSKLTYFGASYGTFLGATYAGLFPTHVGRMVLDGAIDPKLSNAQTSLGQAHGFETALRAYLQDCVEKGGCILGDSVDAAAQRVRQLIDQLDAQPLPTSSGRPLTAGLGVLGIWLPLYVKSYWPLLTQALTEAIKEHTGSALLALSNQYTSRGPNGYTDNSLNALYAVNCLDHDDYIPTDQVPQHYAEFEKSSPTFGRIFAYSLSTCATWPVQDHERSKAISAKGAPPILVVGTTRDPATPYAWAQGLAKELDSGVLLTRDGDGHTGFNQGNSCVDDNVEGFLVDGKVPKDGTRC